MTWVSQLSRLEAKIRLECEQHALRPETRCQICALLHRLHRLVEAEPELEYLPPPQVDRNLEATLDLIWFDRQQQSVLAVTILPPEEGNIPIVRLQYLQCDAVKSDHLDSPTDEQIVDRMKQFWKQHQGPA